MSSVGGAAAAAAAGAAGLGAKAKGAFDRDADRPDRSPARDVRLGGVEPVAAPDEDAGAEGGVDLVTAEGDPVRADRLDVDPAVRDDLRGIEREAGVVLVGEQEGPLEDSINAWMADQG